MQGFCIFKDAPKKQMTKTSNKNARFFVQKREAFKGSNTFGEWKGTVYTVYSYGYHFPLFAYDSIAKQWFSHGNKYSVSTSKHYTQLSPFAEFKKVSFEQLKEIIHNG
jgi:hypothetical protein